MQKYVLGSDLRPKPFIDRARQTVVVPRHRPSHVIVRLPEWLWGDHPAGFGPTARWNLKPVPGSPGSWELSLAEKASGQPAELVRLHRVADSSDLASLEQEPNLQAAASKPLSVQLRGVQDPIVQGVLQHLEDERPDDLAAIAYALNVVMATARPEELVGAIEDIVRDQLLLKAPRASVWVIDHDPAISHRGVGIRMLLQIEGDPSLLTRRPLVGADGLTFKSSRHLYSDTSLGLGAFLQPLFSCRTPWIWGFSAGRPGVVIAYSLGEFVLGRIIEPAEPLQLLSPPSRRPVIVQVAQPALAAFDAAFQWWIEHLDHLFTEMTDPCRHVRSDGTYDVLDHFETLLSIEQAFRHVQSLSVHDRDAHAQRSLMFQALEAIAAVRSPDFDNMCKLTVAKKALEELEADVDPVAADVLLPRARDAVQALEDLQKGFFLPSRIRGSGLLLPDKNGDRVVPYDQAAGMYMRVLRNSQHGFGGRDGTAEERARALLASHDGAIPAELPDLAYLYLLRLLARPMELRG